MSHRHRSQSIQDHRPTLPPIHDLFGGKLIHIILEFDKLNDVPIASDELARSPIPPPAALGSPSPTFSHSSFSDDEANRLSMSRRPMITPGRLRFTSQVSIKNDNSEKYTHLYL